jgi:hypothetical protein
MDFDETAICNGSHLVATLWVRITRNDVTHGVALAPVLLRQSRIRRGRQLESEDWRLRSFGLFFLLVQVDNNGLSTERHFKGDERLHAGEIGIEKKSGLKLLEE